MRSPSGRHHSGIRGREPVETSAVSNSMVSTPSAWTTSAEYGPVKRPVPRMMRTPWLSSSAVVLSRIVCSTRSMRSVSVPTSTEVSTVASPIPPMARVRLIARPVAIIAFDGMQSQRWAAPPTTSRSTITTSAPSRAAVVAAMLPAGPPPMIRNRVAISAPRR
jgi:hypothetical protein